MAVQAGAPNVRMLRAAVTAEAASTEPGVESETAGEPSAESDGPGGHEDIGPNADHQFEGEE